MALEDFPPAPLRDPFKGECDDDKVSCRCVIWCPICKGESDVLFWATVEGEMSNKESHNCKVCGATLTTEATIYIRVICKPKEEK